MEQRRGDDDDGGGGGRLARYSLDVSSGGGAIQLARYSLDVSAGCGGRRSTLLDEYERLAFEAQLNWAILRRCSSEPSPARTSSFVQPAASSGAEEQEAATGKSAWRLHQVVARWLEALKLVLCWLRSVWGRRREEQATPRGPPPTVPRVQLLDYLC